MIWAAEFGELGSLFLSADSLIFGEISGGGVLMAFVVTVLRVDCFNIVGFPVD